MLVVCLVGFDFYCFFYLGMMSLDGDNWVDIFVVVIFNFDVDYLWCLYNLGKLLLLLFYFELKWKGEVNSGNVILDLVGSEKFEEIIFIGGYLDSWDLGMGVVDDGVGVVIIMVVVVLIVFLLECLKCIICVVMFGVEEVGLLGVFVYVK